MKKIIGHIENFHVKKMLFETEREGFSIIKVDGNFSNKEILEILSGKIEITVDDEGNLERIHRLSGVYVLQQRGEGKQLTKVEEGKEV